MKQTTISISDLLAGTSPFDQLSPASRQRLSEKFLLVRYHMGQAILVRETQPAFVAILSEGRARLLGYPPQTKVPQILQLLQPGAVLGWAGLVRGAGCETIIASCEALYQQQEAVSS